MIMKRFLLHSIRSLALAVFILLGISSQSFQTAQACAACLCAMDAPTVGGAGYTAMTAAESACAAGIASQTAAEKPDLWAQIGELGTIVGAIGSLIKFVVTLGGLLGDDISTFSASVTSAEHLGAHIQLNKDDAIIQNNIEVGQATTVARIASNIGMQNNHLCTVTTISTMRSILIAFQQILSAQILETIRTRNTGNGPAFVGKQTASDCKSFYADPFVCPSAKALTAASAGPASTVQLSGSNLRFTTFDGQNTLEYAPDPLNPANDAQKLYVAALDLCMLAAGPRPQPPTTTGTTGVPSSLSSTDLTKLQLFRRAMAIETAFAYQCAKRLAKLTRPPPEGGSDPTGAFALVRQASKDACKAFMDATIPPGANGQPGNGPPNVNAVPADLAAACMNTTATNTTAPSPNLSLYQAEEMDIAACQLATSEAANMSGTVGNAALIQNRYICIQIRNQWETNENQEMADFSDALQNLQEIQSAYAGTDASASLRSQ